MIEKEEMMLEVEEIRQHPDRIWSSQDRELAAAVLEEIREDYPEAVLCGYLRNYWIPLNASQREELREMLESVWERMLDNLAEVEESLRDLHVTEKEKLAAWLDRKMKQVKAAYDGRIYREGIEIGFKSRNRDVYQLHGLEQAAGILGLEVEKREDVAGDVRKSFRYRGREFYEWIYCPEVPEGKEAEA
ncbi:MAG: hypothetical protein NC432_08665 [Roseburia sp.]|nr:hypothetical protein [Roseburia sp.]MCM1097815.1 hypothetical protein [Ruminococcus flavefaciens]